MDDGIRVGSTTDDPSVVVAVAEARPEGTRTPAPKPEAEELDGSSVVTWEHPASERNLLIARMVEQAEADAAEDLGPEKITTNQTEQETEPEAEPGTVDLAAVRSAATEKAIRDGEAWADAQRQSPAAQLVGELGAAKQRFAARMQEIRKVTPNFDALVEQSKKIPEFAPEVGDALLAMDGGPEATAYLLQHLDEASQLGTLSPHVAIARVAEIAAREARFNRQRPMPRPVPAPIRPVGNSSTKSSLPPDQLSYPEFVKMRERQIKERYRR